MMMMSGSGSNCYINGNNDEAFFPLDEPPVLKLIVLAGNPNVGKSVIFNALTGRYVDVSNFPGTTVSVSKGQVMAVAYHDSPVDIHDTPGVYGLSRMSEEETVAEKAILRGDVVVNIVSALSLERDLFLTQQLIDWQRPLIVVVNQLDEAKNNGIVLDLAQLHERLGVPVVGCIATENQGIDELKQALPYACQGHPTPDLPTGAELRTLETTQSTDALRIYGHRRVYLQRLLREFQQHTHTANTPPRLAQRLSQLMLHPVIAGLLLLVVLLSLYQLVGVWIAGDLVKLLEQGIFLNTVMPATQHAVHAVVPATLGWLRELLAGDFGLLTMTPRYILGVIAPLVLGFNLYLSVLEDCGYLPRLAVFSDALLKRIGLNGRAIIPMILGLGCVTMATISTRVLTSQRERTIANTLLSIVIPCSAQLGVIMGMMALAGGLQGWVIYMIILSSLFIGIGTILDGLIPGKSSGLMIDLPPLRLPRLGNVLKKTWTRSISFIEEATPLFLMGAFLVSVAQMTGCLEDIQRFLEPITTRLLHLPKEAASAFIMGMVRRDFGLAGFYQLKDQLSVIQVLTSLVVITLFVPCIASATVSWKERGWKEGLSVLTLSWMLAFGVGAVLTRILEVLPFLK
ncbi:MAG: ferrous iron transport protein B [Vampirovibrionales bacterium]